MSLHGLRQGFASLGCETHVGWPPLPPRVLDAFRRVFKPDIVFEINRTRNALEGCGGSFLHVAWIEAGRYESRWISRHLAGSDRLYFMNPPDLLGVEDMIGQRWEYLWPGADPDVHHPQPTRTEWDLSLTGHLYGPPSPAAAAAPVVIGGAEHGTLGDLLAAAGRWPLHRHTGSLRAVVGNVVDHFRSRGAELTAEDIDPDVLHVVDEYIPRTVARCRVAELMLDVSANVRFFGNDGWLLWPRLAPHYGGEILDATALAQVYRASAVNVHITHWPWHFRTVDCMASGGVIFVNRVDHPDKAREFDAEFVDGEHFVEYGEEDFAEKAGAILRDGDRRARIGAAAARIIADRHTWRHRALRILDDLEWRF